MRRDGAAQVWLRGVVDCWLRVRLVHEEAGWWGFLDSAVADELWRETDELVFEREEDFLGLQGFVELGVLLGQGLV